MNWHALASYEVRGGGAIGLVVKAGTFDLASAPARFVFLKALAEHGILAELCNWDRIAPELAALANDVESGRIQLAGLPPDAKLLEPFTPHRIFAAASNYIEHANEMGTVLAGKAESTPYIFLKASSSVIGPERPIVLPTNSHQVDWEVELAAVIGKGGRNIPLNEALRHVVGYTIMNDVSSRDLTRRNDYPFKHDWFRGKSFDTFGPFGPWLVPASVVGDPQNLLLRLYVNGHPMQDASTSEMIFTVAEQVSYLSSILTLSPGDVIATGTPNGVGMGTGTFLKDGDVVVAEIENIGTLRNPVVKTVENWRARVEVE